MEQAAPLEFSVSTYKGCLGNFRGEMRLGEINPTKEFCIKRISMKTVIPNLSQVRPAKHPAEVLRAVRTEESYFCSAMYSLTVLKCRKDNLASSKQDNCDSQVKNMTCGALNVWKRLINPMFSSSGFSIGEGKKDQSDTEVSVDNIFKGVCKQWVCGLIHKPASLAFFSLFYKVTSWLNFYIYMEEKKCTGCELFIASKTLEIVLPCCKWN